jgi:hypothetical protein
MRYSCLFCEKRDMAGRVGGSEPPRRRRNPGGGAIDYGRRDVAWLECAVNASYELNQFLAPFEAPAQSALREAKTSREIRIGSSAPRTRRRLPPGGQSCGSIG